MTDSSADTPDASCANCGATLTGAYCAKCGQSADALDRNFLALLFEQVGDIFSWDGRLFSTVRELFTRPGRVAREFVEGKRVSHTPPVRLLLLASLALFAAMSVFGLRIVAIAVDSGIVAAGERVPLVPMDGAKVRVIGDAEVEGGRAWVMLTVTAFGGDGVSRLTPAPAEIVEGVTADPRNADLPPFVWSAVRAPADLERAVNAAATQALFSMVAVFALLNLLLHPRRRFLLHATHALYFHSALALVFAVWVVIARLASLPPDWTALPPMLAFLLGAVAFDRGCYGTSVPGLILRIPVLLIGYFIALAVVLVGFTILLVPR
jgi:hypothetical protein